MAEEDVNESEDSATEGEEGGEGKAKGGLNKKLLLIILPILLLGIGAGLFFTGVIGGGDDVEVEAPEKTEEEIAAEEEEAKNANAGFYALPDLIVNLSSAQGTRFLKLKVQLEIADQTKLPEIEAITPRVIDQFQTYLREMRVEDLRGSAGIYRLRQELLYRVNIAAHPVKVNDVLFQEMLIQ
jgi:flagellar FliL protein